MALHNNNEAQVCQREVLADDNLLQCSVHLSLTNKQHIRIE